MASGSTLPKAYKPCPFSHIADAHQYEVADELLR
jgi:hypothetical protein